MTNETLTGLKQQIEEIQKRIKFLSMQVTTSAELKAIESILNTLTELLNNYQEEFDTFVTESQSTLDDFETDITENQEDIAALQTSTETLSNAITSATNTIDNIYSIIDGINVDTGNIVETTNFTNSYKVVTNNYIRYSPLSKIFFINTELTTKIKLKFKLEYCYYEESNNKSIIYIYVNNTCVYNRTVTKTESYDYEMEYEFWPSQKTNKIEVSFFNSLYSKVVKCDIELQGRNIVSLTREMQLRINCFDNKYYIADQREHLENKSHGTIHKDSFDLDNMVLQETTGDYIMTCVTDHQALPFFDITAQVGGFQNGEYDGISVGTGSKTRNIYLIVKKYYTDTNWTDYFQYSTPQVAYDACNYKCIYGNGYTFIILWESGRISATGINAGMTYHTYSTFNGADLYVTGYDVVVVKESAPLITNDYHDLHGFFILDSNMKYHFYNHINATYTLEICKGTNGTAYLQENGDIHFFCRLFNDVYKYILVFNEETQMYEKSAEFEIYRGYHSVQQLYDGKYLVDKEGTFVIVDTAEEITEE